MATLNEPPKGDQITWVDDVQYFFTQYDQIQMLPHKIDLRSYENVRDNAQNIYNNVIAQSKWQMPLFEQRWDEEKIARLPENPEVRKLNAEQSRNGDAQGLFCSLA